MKSSWMLLNLLTYWYAVLDRTISLYLSQVQWGYIWVRREVCSGLWWRNLKKKDHLEEVSICGEDNINTVVKEVGWECMD